MSCCVEQAGEEYSNQCTLSISFSEICCSNVMTCRIKSGLTLRHINFIRRLTTHMTCFVSLILRRATLEPQRCATIGATRWS